MKKIIILLSILLVLCSCTSNKDEPIEQEKTIKELYPEILDDCVIEKASQDDVISMLTHGTGVVFFSWIDCPWCHRYINNLNKICLDNNLKVLYYDIYDDRDNNSEFYQEVINILSTSLDEEGAYDSSGKLRVYVPNVYFVSQGKVIGHDNSSSMVSGFENNGDDYWQEVIDNGKTREADLIERLSAYALDVAKIKEEIDGKGCDTSSSCKL